MKSSIKEQTPQSATLEITLEKQDYQGNFEEEIKKVRSQASIKGFRKGKTPKATILKMYGPSLLSEAVNKAMQDQLWEAIEEQKLEVILSPLIHPDQEGYNFDPKNLEDYSFTFIMGLKPEFEFTGADKDSSIEHYKIVADDETVDKEFELVRKRLGSEESVEKDIEENDRVTINAKETNGKGGIKRGGWDTGFQVLISTLEDKYKKELVGKDVGYEFEFDIHELEKGRDEKYVNKYLLNLDEDEEKEIGRIFKGTVKEIHRIAPAEVNQEFLDKYLGEGVVKTAEEAKEKIRENISNYYEGQSRAYLHRNIMDKLVEENPMEISRDFVMQWVERTNEGITKEQIENEIDAFITNLKWDLITDEVKKLYEVEVTPEDVKDKIRVQVRQYLGGQMPGMDIEPLVDNLMKDEKQFRQAYQEATAEKLLSTVADNITLVEEEVSIEQFGEKVKEMNERVNGK